MKINQKIISGLLGCTIGFAPSILQTLAYNDSKCEVQGQAQEFETKTEITRFDANIKTTDLQKLTPENIAKFKEFMKSELGINIDDPSVSPEYVNNEIEKRMQSDPRKYGTFKIIWQSFGVLRDLGITAMTVSGAALIILAIRLVHKANKAIDTATNAAKVGVKAFEDSVKDAKVAMKNFRYNIDVGHPDGLLSKFLKEMESHIKNQTDSGTEGTIAFLIKKEFNSEDPDSFISKLIRDITSSSAEAGSFLYNIKPILENINNITNPGGEIQTLMSTIKNVLNKVSALAGDSIDGSVNLSIFLDNEIKNYKERTINGVKGNSGISIVDFNKTSDEEVRMPSTCELALLFEIYKIATSQNKVVTKNEFDANFHNGIIKILNACSASANEELKLEKNEKIKSAYMYFLFFQTVLNGECGIWKDMQINKKGNFFSDEFIGNNFKKLGDDLRSVAKSAYDVKEIYEMEDSNRIALNMAIVSLVHHYAKKSVTSHHILAAMSEDQRIKDIFPKIGFQVNLGLFSGKIKQN